MASIGLGFDMLAGFADPKPSVPEAPSVSPAAAQASSVAGNLAALPDLMSLGTGVNRYNQAQLQALAAAGIPGYQPITTSFEKNLEEQLLGRIPRDVGESVRRSRAGMSWEQGIQGSPSDFDFTNRDLGETSYGIQRRAMEMTPNYLEAMRRLTVPAPFDVTSEFVSPAQTIAAQQWNAENLFGRDWLNAQIEQQYSPWHNIAEDIRNTGNTVGQLLAAYLGAMGGGIGGGGGGGAKGGGGGGGGAYLGGGGGSLGGFGSGGGNIYGI